MRIKGFDKNLCCRGFQFEIGGEYKIENDGKPLRLCSDTVFHYCDSLQKVHEFYSVLTENRFCEIEVLGEEITDGKKCGSDHIKILREITGEELEILKGKINGNLGIFNTGNRNTGDCNTTNYNTGCFCTEEHKILFFDRKSDATYSDWLNSDARYLMNRIDFRPTEWIP